MEGACTVSLLFPLTLPTYLSDEELEAVDWYRIFRFGLKILGLYYTVHF